jgi:lantibiotic biosynthesis protein
MTSDSQRAIAIATEIADHLERSAFEYGEEATWMGTQRTTDDDSSVVQTSYGAVGPTLYGGTSGIALFLAEMFSRTRSPRTAALTASAMHYARARIESVPRASRFGFYGGRLGVIYSLARVSKLIERDELLADARTRLRVLLADLDDDFLFDVVLGAAGAIPALLVLRRELEMEECLDAARALGDAIVRGGERRDDGWSWGARATGEVFARNLTGFAHGASGIGWALWELFAATGDSSYAAAARGAFGYEARWFSAARDNWPDFREHDGEAEPAPHAVSWCHGAPGIGLARLRALRVVNEPAYRADLQAAVRATVRCLTDPDEQWEMNYSLCHGQLSLAEFLREASAHVDDPRGLLVADAIITSGIERHETHPGRWASGVGRGANPSLMVGQAGIGYAYLRFADARVPSMLLCGVEALGDQSR